jgi:DNA polymerase V
VDHHLVTDGIVLHIGYDRSSLDDDYSGNIKKDWYGRTVPESAHGTAKLKSRTSSSRLIMDAVIRLYQRIADPSLSIRRITLTAINVVDASKAAEEPVYEQINLFSAPVDQAKEEENKEDLEKENRMQKAIIEIQKKYGKNSVIKGTSLREGATGKERNEQIGGHKA